MVEGARTIYVARLPYLWVGLVAVIGFGWLLIAGPGLRGVAMWLLVLGVATFVARSTARLGVWATETDLVIGNDRRVFRVPKEGASVEIVRIAPEPTEVNELDPVQPGKKLVVTPGRPEDAPITVEAARTMTLRRMRRLEAQIAAEL